MRFSRAFVPLLVWIAVLSGSVLHAAASDRLVRVPQDAKTLDAAIGRVADGGVIEMAAGTYPSPANGFTINNARKGFTVRAAAGAAVALDGGGSRNLLRFVNSDRARGKRVIFEGLTFQNGYSADNGESGGVTLSAAEALFRRCSFVGNRTGGLMTGGGAIKALPGSSATFVDCAFRGNSSPLRGGALVVRSATVAIQGGEFVGNRTNLPGHHPNSFGGAIMVLDGTLNVSGVRFEGNQAGWTGGAIYAIGNWDRGSSVFVTRSTFTGNQAVADPCCANPIPTSGGAIHAEDLTVLRVHGSLFARNRANVGGAVDGYRPDVEIHGSVFQANAGAGGAIAMVSPDSADSSTDFGAINRPNARLVVTQSLLQGGSEETPATGGCILASGDSNRAYGNGAIAQAGTMAENRARVEIRGTVFSNCDAATAADGSGGLGGALAGELIDLDMADSMVLDSDARGPAAGGGGIALRQESNARIVRTTFAHNSSDKWGGALFVSGSTVQVDGCRFYGNDVVPGAFEGLSESRGAAIYTIPFTNAARPRNVGGVVANSIFSDNLGVPVWDVDPQDGPVNEMRYDGNRFDPVVFGDRVYVEHPGGPGRSERRGAQCPDRLPRRPPGDAQERRPQRAGVQPQRGGSADRPLPEQRRRRGSRAHRVVPRLCLERRLGGDRDAGAVAGGGAPGGAARGLRADGRSGARGGGQGHGLLHGGSLSLPRGQPFPRRADLEERRRRGARPGGGAVGGYGVLLVRRSGQCRDGRQGARRPRPERQLLGLLRRPHQSRLHPDGHRHRDRRGEGLHQSRRQIRQRRRHQRLSRGGSGGRGRPPPWLPSKPIRGPRRRARRASSWARASRSS